MSTEIVFSQMLIIFALMLIGMFLSKKQIISRTSSKDLSSIVVNICSPMQLIMSVLNQDSQVGKDSLVRFFFYGIAVYVVLIILGYIVNMVLRVPRKQQGDYHLMTIFGNCGFIGIPVAQALIGPQSLIYVAIFNLCYNMFFYTYGFWIITSDIEGVTIRSQLKKMLNPGTVACIITILIFWFDIQVPVQIQSFCSYAGQPATLLALLVIGISLSDMSPRDMINDRRFFAFTILRFALFPIAFVCVLKLFISDTLILKTMALMVAVPVGNMPAMVRDQFEQDDRLTAKGAVITTALSVITITTTCMFL